MAVLFALDSTDLNLLRESTIGGEEESPNRLGKRQKWCGLEKKFSSSLDQNTL
jgi:hypothetical protein